MKFCFAADGSNLATQDRKIALVQGGRRRGCWEPKNLLSNYSFSIRIGKAENAQSVVVRMIA